MNYEFIILITMLQVRVSCLSIVDLAQRDTLKDFRFIFEVKIFVILKY